MPYKLQIPDELLVLYPKYNIAELRTIIKTILNAKTHVIRQSDIFSVKLPRVGVLKSRGNKKPKSYKKTLKKDRIRKRRKPLTKEKLLW